MTLTLLIDLDDTLLSNEIVGFQKAYFKLLSDAISPWSPPEKMMSAMMAAIKAMLIKNTPALTLEEQFDQIFYPYLGVQKGDLLETIRDFYERIFPELRPLTAPRPAAIDLIKRVFDRGWDVIVATNPVFPKTAVMQRLEWAHLSPAQYPYKLITTYEMFHFCKPNPAFYAEILGNLNWPQGPVVMVGNSLNEDIIPAEKIGLPTYWIGSDSLVEERNIQSRTGNLEGVFDWLITIDTAQPYLDFQTETSILSTLRSTPAVFYEMTRSLAHQGWDFRPAAGEWNVIEILAHMRDVDLDVNLGRITATISGENPFLPGADTDPWVLERNYSSEDGLNTLNGFITARTELLTLLDSANTNALAQPARHAIFGPTTLKELLGFIATHDRTHVRQAFTTIKAASAESA